MNATIRLSNHALRNHAIDTGELLEAEISLEVPLKAMTNDERREFLEITGVEAHVSLTYFAAQLYGAFFETQSVPNSPEDWLNIARAYAAAQIAHTAQEQLDNERYQMQRIQHLERVQADLERAFERAEALTEDEFRWGWAGVKRELTTIIQKLDASDERNQALQRVAGFDEYLRTLQRSDEHRKQAEYDAQIQAIAKRETERKEQLTKALKDLEGWIVKNGSVALVQSWQIGDDVRAMYAYERARFEHPGFKLDEYRTSRWMELTSASRQASQLADISGGEAVWLIQPPRKIRIGDPWTPREGVIVQGYLGMYTLVAELDNTVDSQADS